jgi:hypothetical protein
VRAIVQDKEHKAKAQWQRLRKHSRHAAALSSKQRKYSAVVEKLQEHESTLAKNKLTHRRLEAGKQSAVDEMQKMETDLKHAESKKATLQAQAESVNSNMQKNQELIDKLQKQSKKMEHAFHLREQEHAEALTDKDSSNETRLHELEAQHTSAAQVREQEQQHALEQALTEKDGAAAAALNEKLALLTKLEQALTEKDGAAAAALHEKLALLTKVGSMLELQDEKEQELKEAHLQLQEARSELRTESERQLDVQRQMSTKAIHHNKGIRVGNEVGGFGRTVNVVDVFNNKQKQMVVSESSLEILPAGTNTANTTVTSERTSVAWADIWKWRLVSGEGASSPSTLHFQAASVLFVLQLSRESGRWLVKQFHQWCTMHIDCFCVSDPTNNCPEETALNLTPYGITLVGPPSQQLNWREVVAWELERGEVDENGDADTDLFSFAMSCDKEHTATDELVYELECDGDDGVCLGAAFDSMIEHNAWASDDSGDSASKMREHGAWSADGGGTSDPKQTQSNAETVTTPITMIRRIAQAKQETEATADLKLDLEDPKSRCSSNERQVHSGAGVSNAECDLHSDRRMGLRQRVLI